MLFYHTHVLMILIVIQSLCLLVSNNTINSVSLLINIYLTTSIVYIIIGAEFLALSLIIIYVGAISILFLFVIMMLNLRTVELYNKYTIYIPIGYVIVYYLYLKLFIS